MPELPEVETIKKALKLTAENSFIEQVIVRDRRFRVPVPEDFAEKITASKILKIYRLAKYVILELSNGFSIVWHFGMSGRIRFSNTIPQNFSKHDHIIIATNKKVLIFNDARRFGLITYVKTAELQASRFFEHIGVDPFAPELTVAYLIKQFNRKKTPVKDALLQQNIICGIGNIYASEILYRAQISPLRKCCNLLQSDILNLIEAIRVVLNEAIAAGGSTLKDYRKPNGDTGYFQHFHCVYNKTGQRCPNCTCDISKTGGIVKIVQNGRSTFFCPNLQK